jgi:CDP-diacylglycerol--glycerol-3-phosphate 3-phosphatidyltransferase
MSNFRVKRLTPSIITSIRVILAPIFFLTILNNLLEYSLIIFLFAMGTDILDGYFSRKWNVSSFKGAYFDVIADFILVLAGFLAFAIKGIYPYWILVVIVFMFIQFMVTSRLKNPIYDPVGKYYGAFLFIAIFIGLITNNSTINMILTVLILIFTVISITSRILFVLKSNKYGNILK